jgi:YD repeat-containing protein
MKVQTKYSTAARLKQCARQFGMALAGAVLAGLTWSGVQAGPLQKVGEMYYESVEPVISPYRHFLNLPNGEGNSSGQYRTLGQAEDKEASAKDRAIAQLRAKFPQDTVCGVGAVSETHSPISYSPTSAQKTYRASTTLMLKRDGNQPCGPDNLGSVAADLVESGIAWDYSCPHGYSFGPFDANGVITCRRPLNYCSGQCGNPVTHASEKIQPELDYRSADGMLELVRTYRSSRYPEPGWTNNYEIRIVPDATLTTVVRGDGSRLYFAWDGSKFNSIQPTQSSLTRLPDGTYRYTSASDVAEYYDRNGFLSKLLHRDGKSVSLERSAPSATVAFLTATDSYGRKLTLRYEKPEGGGELYLASSTLPDGSVYQYQHNLLSGMLQQVTRDGFVRIYEYDGQKLTGIVDENNQRYAQFNYGQNGFGVPITGTKHANRVDNYQVSDTRYQSGSGMVSVQEPLGLTSTYQYSNINGISRMTSITRGAQGQSTLGYDANGNVASRIDFNGNQTKSRYDLARNLETSRTEGLTASGATTPHTRTIDTTWHAQWHLPTREVTKNAQGVPILQIDMDYDSFGHLTRYQMTDLVLNQSRTTRYDYRYSSSVAWHVERLTITGPRSDIADVTIIDYWPFDAACPGSGAGADTGCRGNIKAMTNAKSQISTYDAYDAHGRATLMHDANGLLTEMQYTPRGWMTSISIDGETTNYDYDGVGQVKTITLPDAATLSYGYDSAQRLIRISDNLGNSVSYVLDNMGNRSSETIKDPGGNLKRQISRVHDNLSRMTTVTGAAQ